LRQLILAITKHECLSRPYSPPAFIEVLQNKLAIEQRVFLEIPQWKTIWREAKGTLEQFLTNAISIFLVISAIASIYLAGVLLPCLLTALTIAREQSLKFALGLMVRQATAAIIFTLILAWGGRLFL
jgi:Fe2+ transport system protein B